MHSLIFINGLQLNGFVKIITTPLFLYLNSSFSSCVLGLNLSYKFCALFPSKRQPREGFASIGIEISKPSCCRPLKLHSSYTDSLIMVVLVTSLFLMGKNYFWTLFRRKYHWLLVGTVEVSRVLEVSTGRILAKTKATEGFRG